MLLSSTRTFKRKFLSWSYLARLFTVVFGLFLFAAGIVLTYRAEVGLDPWDVLHQGISRHTPLSFGTANIVVGGALIVLGLLLKLYPGFATILNMLLVGSFVDLLLHFNVIPSLSWMPLYGRLLVDGAGVLVIGLGTAFYILPRLGAGPRDGLMIRLHELTKQRLALVRGGIELSVLAIGFLLGGSVGIGTLIFALGIGPAVEASFYLLKRVLPAWLSRTAGSEKPERLESYETL